MFCMDSKRIYNTRFQISGRQGGVGGSIFSAIFLLSSVKTLEICSEICSASIKKEFIILGFKYPAVRAALEVALLLQYIYWESCRLENIWNRILQCFYCLYRTYFSIFKVAGFSIKILLKKCHPQRALTAVYLKPSIIKSFSIHTEHISKVSTWQDV